MSGLSPGVQVPGLIDTWGFPGYGSPPGLPWACQVSTAGQVGRPGMDGTAMVHGTAPPPPAGIFCVLSYVNCFGHCVCRGCLPLRGSLLMYLLSLLSSGEDL